MTTRILKHLLDLPKWGFFGLIILTPWAWGGIPIWLEVFWAKVCLGICLAYVVSGALQRSLSCPPVLPLVASAWVLAEGWWMVANAAFQHAPQLHGFWRLAQWHPGWPGSLDRASSLRTMWKISALLLAFYVASDLALAHSWRKRLVFTLVLAGGAVAAFGLIMRIQSQSGIWPDLDRNNYPFGTFYYHGNAAAYLNTILPISLACLQRGLFTETRPIIMAILICVLLLVGSGAIVCASKVGMVIAVILSLISMAFFWNQYRGRFDQTTFQLPTSVLWMVIVGVAGLLMVLIGEQAVTNRWQYVLVAGNSVLAGRQETARICLASLTEAGWCGFGAGTFPAIFPALARQQHVILHGIWLDAHEDYLQTLLEWGRSGAIAWGLIFFGALGQALGRRRLWFEFRRHDRILTLGIALSLLGCALHALVDFPLQITAIELNIMVVLGLLWSVPRWEIHTRNRRKISAARESAEGGTARDATQETAE